MINNNPVNKSILTNDLKKMRNLFGKSISLKNDLKKGSILNKEDLIMKKPGFGFKENQMRNIIGRKLLKNVSSKRISKKRHIMKKRKICVVINNRANYARIKSALIAIKKNKKLELQIVLGSSAILDRYGSVSEVIKKDGFKINRTVYTLVEGENLLTMSKSTGISIMEFSTVFSELRPDMVIVIADRYETLAAAIAASYMNIILVHTQGGETTGSIDESVRHAITKLSHIHFPASLNSKKNIIRMGENPDKVF